MANSSFQHFLRGCTTFSGNGRVNKEAYWAFSEWYVLVVATVAFLLFVLVPEPAVLAGMPNLHLVKAGVVFLVADIWLFITMTPMTVKRLHDTGRSGWHYLNSHNIFRLVALVQILLQESQPGQNRYGPAVNAPSGHSQWTAYKQYLMKTQERTQPSRSDLRGTRPDWQAPPIERHDPLTLFFKGMFTFSGTGRATRMEYWCFALPYFLIVSALFYLWLGELGGYIIRFPLLGGDTNLLHLGWLVVTLAPMTVRRLHDTGRSGWMYLHVVWIVGWLILIVVLSLRSQESLNQYDA